MAEDTAVRDRTSGRGFNTRCPLAAMNVSRGRGRYRRYGVALERMKRLYEVDPLPPDCEEIVAWASEFQASPPGNDARGEHELQVRSIPTLLIGL